MYSDGDHLTGNAMEASAWSLQDDAHKPGRLWTGKTFWMNPVFEADYIDRMFAKCHEDIVKAPLNPSYLIGVPELRDAPWYKRWVKYYDIVDKHPSKRIEAVLHQSCPYVQH